MLDDIRSKKSKNPDKVILSVRISLNRELDVEVEKSQDEQITIVLQNLYYTWVKSSQEEIGNISCEEYILDKLNELNINYICEDEVEIRMGNINKKEYYRVPVTWRVAGTVYIEAESPEEAAQLAISQDRYGDRSRVIHGTVEVPHPEKILSDREYRRSNGIGPQYHIIDGESPEQIQNYVEKIKDKALKTGQKITSNIPNFTNTHDMEFNKCRTEILLSYDVCENLFYYDEVVVDGKEIYILCDHNALFYTKEFIENLKVLIRQGDVLIMTLPYDGLKRNEENIIYMLLWRYIHTFREIYIVTDNESYTDFGSEINMTCHWIDNDGADIILDTDTFDDKLSDHRMAREKANYVPPTFGLPTVPISKKDRCYKTPGVRRIYSEYTSAIGEAAERYFKFCMDNIERRSIDFELYTHQLSTGEIIQVIEGKTQEIFELGPMYFWVREPEIRPIRSEFLAPLPYWIGTVRVVNDGSGIVMYILKDRMPKEE